jgi:nucleotide-binding universal stress UspA family protein
LIREARSPEAEEFAQKWAREHDEMMRDHQSRMQALARGLPVGLSSGEPLVAEGEAADQILAATHREGSDLVVIGVKQKRSLTNAVFGSTSETVLNHATCSVLLVPHPETP